MSFDVVFRYIDDDSDPDDDDGGSPRVSWPTEAEAKAFAEGLTYGDEPQYEVLAIEPTAS